MGTYDGLFRWYVDRFDVLNRDEMYKWEACQQFQDCWKPDEPDFAGMLKKALGRLSNITDAGTSPRRGIELFAEQEPETVREMFLALFSEGDLETRINRFIRDSESLRERLGYQSYYRYKQSPRSVMAYLACWKPDEHFFYKWEEAHKFAQKIGFEYEWGLGSSFKPDIYYRRCNQLIGAMRQCDELMAVNETRFSQNSQKLWPDKAFHILAYDVIFCTCSEMYNS